MIEIKNITKDYIAGDMTVRALKGVSINFRNSEFVSILGPSGCGKTTLLNIIGGLDQYTSGDIIIDGVSTKDYKDKEWDTYRNHYIGFVFQNYNLIAHLSILENVELALSIAGISKAEKRKRAIEALGRVGLKDQVKKRPNQLSGGQMQRVAIARAIVNNPKIILADEPTGALDSETSVQVMDILKEISKTHLVVMVTHNASLAEKYSDRIINILDGEVTSDTKPYKPSKQQSIDAEVNKKHSAMGLITAFMLSLKNLISKKWKTFLVSFAGSIGIIGIALVLAVSNGLNAYVANMQSNALSGYPITVGTVAIDYDSVTNYFSERDKNENASDSDDSVNAYSIGDVLFQFGNFNFLNAEFLDYMQDYVDNDVNGKKSINAYMVSYDLNLQVLTDIGGLIMNVNTKTQTSSMSGTSSGGSFFEEIGDREFIEENYNVYGDYPTDKSQVALVLPQNNTIAIEVLNSLGLAIGVSPTGEQKVVSINYQDLLNKEYRFFTNNEYYDEETGEDGLVFTPKTFASILDQARVSSKRDEMQALYQSIEDNTLEISCVLRAKDDTVSEVLSQGIMYTHDFANYLRQTNKESNIATETLKLGLEDNFYIPFNLEISELSYFMDAGQEQSFFKYDNAKQIINTVKEKYNVNLSKDDAIQMALQMVGASNIPSSVSFYASSFDAKKNVISHIDTWNNTEHTANNKIVYSDAAGFLTETLGSLIDIISYVLIAFAAISLVVSSIMIGIITYTSVIERTKEIGVLRSIGARKKDIARVFNSETFIIGLTAGLIGVIVSFLLTFPISAIIKGVAGGAITTQMAILTLPNAVILVLISVVLTLIAGLIPARIASKKDPVKALRTE